MTQSNYMPVTGIVQEVAPFGTECCSIMVSILTQNGITNLIVSQDTYVIDSIKFQKGMRVTGFYDANQPAILIYPPQFQAIVIGQQTQENIAFEYFDRNLTASDGSLQLNVAPSTEIVMSNGQKFFCEITDRYLVVYYRATTRSIPPQTTPRKIIVLC